MIYGPYNEGHRRECSNCGRFTSDFSYCETCDMTICEGCEHTCIAPEQWVEMKPAATEKNYGHQYNLFEEIA
jgi:hypothetical protein